MKITRCDICNNEMRNSIFDRDSETQYYTLINKYAGRELETDICNGCMHKLIDFVNAPSLVPNRQQGEWIVRENGNNECSVCGREKQDGWINFCGFCGAKMKGADNE